MENSPFFLILFLHYGKLFVFFCYKDPSQPGSYPKKKATNRD
ncbi:hypothetical protein LEP1GSC185_0638 [Leptospira licerasiae serovar Varillal str. VAR 010]|nr:hypothetical protein LEP1GSC185_0638 [Leptospira licerasiae serovar Varillal str. VAR 010]